MDTNDIYMSQTIHFIYFFLLLHSKLEHFRYDKVRYVLPITLKTSLSLMLFKKKKILDLNYGSVCLPTHAKLSTVKPLSQYSTEETVQR